MAQPRPRMHGVEHGHGGPDVVRIAWESDGAAGAAFVKAMPFSINGVLAVGNGVLRWYPLADGTLAGVHCAVGVAPTGSGVTVRLKKNGASVGTGTIAAGAFTTTFVPSPAGYVVGDYFTVDVTAVGSTTPGTGLVVQLRVT